MTSEKVLIDLATHWGTRDRYFDISIAYVKADKEDGYQVYLRVPKWMNICSDELKRYGETDEIRM